jgi:hypothetical protein
MNKVRSLLILLLGLFISAVGREKDVLAILCLEANGVAGKDISAIMSEISRQFSRDTGFIVLEEEMIGMMLREQGFDRSATCSNLQCYTGIGHLLTVTKVIGGTVTVGADKMVTVSLDLADIAKSEMICQESGKGYSVSALLKNEIPKISAVMLEKCHQWEYNQDVHLTNTSQIPVTKKKKRPLLRALGWLSTGALFAGGAVGVYYKFIRPENESSKPQSTGGPDEPAVVGDVPTGDVPVHTR